MPHPLPKATEFEQDKDRLIVGLSNSNDEGVVKKIFKEYKNTNFLRDLKYKLAIKAKKLSYNDEYLRILNGWITKEEYINYSKIVVFISFLFQLKVIPIELARYCLKRFQMENLFWHLIFFLQIFMLKNILVFA